MLSDGRPTAQDNWHEVTGIARGTTTALVADPDGPAARSPYGDGALRYASAVLLPHGSTRFSVEAARADGGHDLVTCVSRA